MIKTGYTNNTTAKDLYSDETTQKETSPFDQNPFDKNPFDGELQQVMTNENVGFGQDEGQIGFQGENETEKNNPFDSKTETNADPVEEAWLIIANYIDARKGKVNEFSELPFSSKQVHLYLKVSKENETPVYVHVKILSDGKPNLQSITKADYEVNKLGYENKLLYARDKNGRTAEIFLSNMFMHEVVVYALDLDRLEKLRLFAKNDEGFWTTYNYPEDEAALLFASLNSRERSEIIQSEALLEQIGSKLSKAQFARGLQNLDLSLHKKLELLSNGKNAYTHRGIMFQDLRGVLLSSGDEGKKMDERLAEVFPLTAIIREQLLLDEGKLTSYIDSRRSSDSTKPKSSNMIGDLLFDDMLDNDEMTLTPAETVLINSIVEGGKTLADLSDSEKKTMLTAFQRNAL